MTEPEQQPTEQELMELAASTVKWGLHDAGNSRRFSRRFLGRLIHVRGPGWYRWTGRVWTHVPDEDLLREAKLVAKKIWDEVQLAEDNDQRARIAQWAHKSAMRPKLEAMVKLAAAGEIRDEDLKVGGVGQLDQHRDLLNTPSGIVDLRTGEVLDHEEHKDEYCTRMTRVSFTERAPMDGWDEFLRKFWPDPSVRATLKLLAGASATGYPLKVLVCMIGPDGDNGKTTFVEAIKSTLGSYSGTALESTFTNANAREAQYDLANLRGIRFVPFSETRQGHGLAAERVKRVTGGDTISARAPYGKPFEYSPSFTLWMATNHAPKIPAGEQALWKRIWAVPCTEVIAPKEQVQDYAEVLVQQHGAGIMRWIVEGAQSFYEHSGRLPRQPMAMREYLAQWQDRDNVVKRWVEERTQAGPRFRTPFRECYADFRDWAEENGEEIALRDYSSQKFHEALDEHFERSETQSKGGYRRLGMALRNHAG